MRFLVIKRQIWNFFMGESKMRLFDKLWNCFMLSFKKVSTGDSMYMVEKAG